MQRKKIFMIMIAAGMLLVLGTGLDRKSVV